MLARRPFLLGVTRIRRGILASPADASPNTGDQAIPEVAEQLMMLGFVPAGIYWEQMPAHERFHEWVYVSNTGDCFAAIYRLFDNDCPRLALKTAFTDGAYVMTQNVIV